MKRAAKVNIFSYKMSIQENIFSSYKEKRIVLIGDTGIAKEGFLKSTRGFR
jgi:hypothetical protein